MNVYFQIRTSVPEYQILFALSKVFNWPTFIIGVGNGVIPVNVIEEFWKLKPLVQVSLVRFGYISEIVVLCIIALRSLKFF